MALKTVTREEANLTNWLLSQIAMLEQQTGKKITTLELAYDGTTGESGINLVLEAPAGGQT